MFYDQQGPVGFFKILQHNDCQLRGNVQQRMNRKARFLVIQRPEEVNNRTIELPSQRNRNGQDGAWLCLSFLVFMTGRRKPRMRDSTMRIARKKTKIPKLGRRQGRRSGIFEKKNHSSFSFGYFFDVSGRWVQPPSVLWFDFSQSVDQCRDARAIPSMFVPLRCSVASHLWHSSNQQVFTTRLQLRTPGNGCESNQPTTLSRFLVSFSFVFFPRYAIRLAFIFVQLHACTDIFCLSLCTIIPSVEVIKYNRVTFL